MNNTTFQKENSQKSIAFKNFTREVLNTLVNRESIQRLSIEEIETDESTTETKQSFEIDIRYKEEKELIQSMLFDTQLKQLMNSVYNQKYDYMIGFHAYISSNPNFKYGFSCFIEKLKEFNYSLEQWDKFLDMIVSDIQKLPPILINQMILVEFESIIRLSIKNNSIINASFDLQNLAKAFSIGKADYRFNLFLSEFAKNRDYKIELFDSGRSNGTGTKSGLYNCISKFNESVRNHFNYKNEEHKTL